MWDRLGGLMTTMLLAGRPLLAAEATGAPAPGASLRSVADLQAAAQRTKAVVALPVFESTPEAIEATTRTVIEAANLDDAINRALELMSERARDDSHRQRKVGTTYSARVTAVVAGQRAVLDVIERPTAGGSAGIAVDVSELEAVRTDLQRQMDAHVRTLDQLPTAVAIFDAGQNLIFSNAAYQHLWNLDAAFLASRSSRVAESRWTNIPPPSLLRNAHHWMQT